MITISLILIALIVMFCLATKFAQKEIILIVGGYGSIIFALVLGVHLLVWPIQYMYNVSAIAKFKATRDTCASRLDTFDRLERATLINKVIEQNQWLAQAQMWNETMFDYYVPDEVMELELIAVSKH